MKPGDVVMIYRDEITRKVPEGMAELVEQASVAGSMERWCVRFVPVGYRQKYVRRYILNEPMPAEMEMTR